MRVKPKILIDATTIQEQKDGLSQYIISLLANFPETTFELFDISVLINKNLKREEIISLISSGNFTFIEAGIATIGPKRDWDMFWFFKKNRTRFDLFHSTSNQFPLCIKKGIATIHDITFKKYFDNARWSFNLAPRYINLVVKHALRKAQAIIAVSAHTRNDLIETYSLSDQQAKKILVIHEGWQHIATAQRLTVHTENTNKYGKYLFYVGNSRVHKNIHNLVVAFALLKEDSTENINLVISGDIKNIDSIVLNAIDKINTGGKRIFCTGSVDDKELDILYRNAHAFIFPSLAEGFGIPVLETFYFKKPLLCSNTSSFPEIAGDAALYFDPFDSQDIAASVSYLLKNPSCIASLVIKGQERLQLFSWQKMATETVNLYKKILLP